MLLKKASCSRVERSRVSLFYLGGAKALTFRFPLNLQRPRLTIPTGDSDQSTQYCHANYWYRADIITRHVQVSV